MAFKIQRYLYQNPQSVMMICTETALMMIGLVHGVASTIGINLNYSKFVGLTSSQIPSKMGMIITYFPSCVICSLFLVCMLDWKVAEPLVQKLGISNLASTMDPLGQTHSRLLILSVILAMHFSKRVFEVMFIHRYSGGMSIFAAVVLAASYPFIAMSLLCTTHISAVTRKPEVNLILPGTILCFVGSMGNSYHHYLLRKLRKVGEKKYSIPRGALFELVACPHYLCEIIEWIGIAFVCQTLYAFCMVGMMFLTLLGRSVSTKKWYIMKFEDFPQTRKALIPWFI